MCQLKWFCTGVVSPPVISVPLNNYMKAVIFLCWFHLGSLCSTATKLEFHDRTSHLFNTFCNLLFHCPNSTESQLQFLYDLPVNKIQTTSFFNIFGENN